MLFLQLVLFAIIVRAKSIYISSSTGDDGQDGLGPYSAIKSFTQLNSLITSRFIGDGDEILFRRGDTFGVDEIAGVGNFDRGLVSVPGWFRKLGSISIGAYGPTTLPIPALKGSISVRPSAWTRVKLPNGSNAWSTILPNAPTRIAAIFYKGKRMLISTWPNQPNPLGPQAFPEKINCDFIDTQSINRQQSAATIVKICSANLAGVRGLSWVGASVVVRVNPWSYGNYQVVRGYPDTGCLDLTLAPTGGYEINSPDPNAFPRVYNRTGFLLVNHLSALDSPGEWFYDSASGTLYFKTPDGIDPNSNGGISLELVVAGAAFTFPAAIGLNTLLISDLALKNFIDTGIFVGNALGSISLSRLRIEGVVAGSCVLTTSFMDTRVADSSVRSCMQHGISAASSAGSITLLRNTLSDIHLVRAELGNWAAGIHIRACTPGINSVIEGNQITRTGASGIRNEGKCPLTIRGNVISQGMLVLTDQGGYYGANSQHVYFENNVIDRMVGNEDSLGGSADPAYSPWTNPGTNQLGGHAIYLDFDSQNITLLNNIFANGYAGLNWKYARDSRLMGNRYYNQSVCINLFSAHRNVSVEGEFFYNPRSGRVMSLGPGSFPNLLRVNAVTVCYPFDPYRTVPNMVTSALVPVFQASSAYVRCPLKPQSRIVYDLAPIADFQIADPNSIPAQFSAVEKYAATTRVNCDDASTTPPTLCIKAFARSDICCYDPRSASVTLRYNGLVNFTGGGASYLHQVTAKRVAPSAGGGSIKVVDPYLQEIIPSKALSPNPNEFANISWLITTTATGAAMQPRLRFSVVDTLVIARYRIDLVLGVRTLVDSFNSETFLYNPTNKIVSHSLDRTYVNAIDGVKYEAGSVLQLEPWDCAILLVQVADASSSQVVTGQEKKLTMEIQPQRTNITLKMIYTGIVASLLSLTLSLLVL